MRSSCAVRCRPCRSTRATAATHNALEMCSPRLRLSRHSAKRRLTCSRLSPCSPACADFVAIFIICSIHAIDMGDDDSKQINKNHAALPEGHEQSALPTLAVTKHYGHPLKESGCPFISPLVFRLGETKN